MRERSHAGLRPRSTCHDGHAIGLDLGASSVRATVLAVVDVDGEPVVEVRAVAGAPLAPGTVVGGAVADRHALTAALVQLWNDHDLPCRNVILGVASPQVLVRELEMPNLGPAQRAKALPFQARELTAVPLDQMVLDFAPLGESTEHPGMQKGLLVACPREPVLAAVAAVEAADLRVVRVDLSSLAVLRSIADRHREVEVVVDLGAHLSTVVVHQHGVPRLVRTLPRGGEELTRRLGDRLDLRPDEAEAAKRRCGLTSSEPASTVLRELVAPLLGEVRSSLNYFRTNHPQARIERIGLTGGGAALLGLSQLFGDQLGILSEVVDPGRLLTQARRTKVPLDTHEWVSAQSVGLAIGAAA